MHADTNMLIMLWELELISRTQQSTEVFQFEVTQIHVDTFGSSGPPDDLWSASSEARSLSRN